MSTVFKARSVVTLENSRKLHTCSSFSVFFRTVSTAFTTGENYVRVVILVFSFAAKFVFACHFALIL
jgi:hypothetical protein